MNASGKKAYWNSGQIMSAVLSDKDFARLSHYIHSECGIKMPVPKKVMLEARLRKRLRARGIESFEEYCDFLFSPEGMEQERVCMIDVVTTNKTDFFREPRHFEYLVQHAVPELIRLCGAGTRRSLQVWSAGCSTGEEPYTLAMVLSEFAARTLVSISLFLQQISRHRSSKGRFGGSIKRKGSRLSPWSLRRNIL